MKTFGLGQINSGIMMMQALGLIMACVMVPHVRGREDEK